MESQTDFRTVKVRPSPFRESVCRQERQSTGPIGYFRSYIFTLIKLNVREKVVVPFVTTRYY